MWQSFFLLSEMFCCTEGLECLFAFSFTQMVLQKTKKNNNTEKKMKIMTIIEDSKKINSARSKINNREQ